MALDNLTSAVTYPDIFPGADLEYIVSPSKIKENIVVKEQSEAYTYRFDLALNGLMPIPQKDGSIHLVAPPAMRFWRLFSIAILAIGNIFSANGRACIRRGNGK